MSDGNQSTNLSIRLLIKSIPETFSNDQLNDILNKNFANKIHDINITKSVHKYASKNNKICYLTIDSLEVRKEIIDFFTGFELVDPKGYKQRLTILDCLYQTKFKPIKDSVENTISNSKYSQFYT